MKYLLSFLTTAAVLMTFQSCSKPGSKVVVADALSRILYDNAEILYKSEINRMRVAFNHDKRILIYHFWKTERFEENGTLFFHLYPEDKSNLPENRKKYGFVNFNLPKDLFVTHDTVNYYLLLKMPEYAVSEITTGQFKSGKRNWFTNETFSEQIELKTNITAKDFKLINQASDYIVPKLGDTSDSNGMEKFTSLLELTYFKESSENSESKIYSNRPKNIFSIVSSIDDKLNCEDVLNENQLFAEKEHEDFVQYNFGNGCLLFFKIE